LIPDWPLPTFRRAGNGAQEQHGFFQGCLYYDTDPESPLQIQGRARYALAMSGFDAPSLTTRGEGELACSVRLFEFVRRWYAATYGVPLMCM
jgi:hypothetical protein